MSEIHHVTEPQESFDAIRKGAKHALRGKRFERCQVGDRIVVREVDGDEPTGRDLMMRVTYIEGSGPKRVLSVYAYREPRSI